MSIAACAALTALAVTDLYAGAPAPIPGGVPGGGAVPGGIPGGAAASPEQRDAIARLMEQERQRLAQQLQNNPIVAIQVEQAQKIAKAIEEIRVKAEELKFILRLELDRATRAENIALAAGTPFVSICQPRAVGFHPLIGQSLFDLRGSKLRWAQHGVLFGNSIPFQM